LVAIQTLSKFIVTASIYSDQCTNLYTEKTIQHVFNQYTLIHQQHVKVSQIKKSNAIFD